MATVLLHGEIPNLNNHDWLMLLITPLCLTALSIETWFTVFIQPIMLQYMMMESKCKGNSMRLRVQPELIGNGPRPIM